MKKLFAIVFAAGLVFSLSNCSEDSQESDILRPPANPGYYKLGLKLVSENCLSCHSGGGDVQTPIAPSLQEIKQAYLEEGMTEKDFVASMAGFLSMPGSDGVRMPKSVEQFGAMPNLGFSNQEYEAAATYLYRSPLEEDGWFTTRFAQEQEKLLGASEQNETYLERGKRIALSTKAVLGKNLLTAIQERGTTEALSFCNERAVLLTDSMSQELKAHVKRVSDQNRNPQNAASADELAYIDWAKDQIEKGGKAAPRIIEKEGGATGYYPILTNEMCLQCHGSPDGDIEQSTLERITALYPEDLARGYGTNQLRGIWVVQMEAH